MCTAISFSSNNNHYFGRNLDLNYPFKESIIVTPRKYEIRFKCLEPMKDHYAIFGVGISKFDYPLYFDCINEYGLGFAGLNFPEFAKFSKPIEGKINIQPYELPLYMLGKYKTVKEVKEAFKNVYLSNIPLDEKLPVSTLHFIFSDSTGSIVVEQTSDGLKIYDNKFNVLTNNPPFYFHELNVNQYLNLTTKEPSNRFTNKFELKPFSKAMGSVGLPGDSSSISRFVKATYLLANIDRYENRVDADSLNVNQAFHVLNNVSTLKGESIMDDGSEEYTVYSSIYDANNQQVYVKTYENNCLQVFNLKNVDLLDNKLSQFEISHNEETKIIK